MTTINADIQAFFVERLGNQLHASPHTVTGYRDTFRLFLGFASARAGRLPSELEFGDIDAEVVADFLAHLEHDRGNSIRSRNVRLTALRSFFRFASYRRPEHAALVAQVLAIPQKRTTRHVVSYLTPTEIEALFAAPDRSTWHGRRDHALLVVACQGGLRVAELVGLRFDDVELAGGAHLKVRGKGRKERCVPLTSNTVAVLRQWLKELRARSTGDVVFPTVRGAPLSHDAVALLVAKHVGVAALRCRTIMAKNVTPHTLRHSCAMSLLAAGVDTSVIALWLGHEQVQTTQIYLHGDLSMKERALARTAPPGTPPGRYRPPDKLVAFLESL
jgi:integrase/recombinase XerD